MVVKWCWRCKMSVPMLDNEEAKIASDLYSQGFRQRVKDRSENKGKLSREERFKPLLDYYFQVTGFKETEPNAIMHHFISIYGPDCEVCERPYRTPKAKLCAYCGNKRLNSVD